MVDPTPRPRPGLPAVSFDAKSFKSRVLGMDRTPFAHATVVEAGPGRRHCPGHQAGLDAAICSLKRSTATVHAESMGQHIWIEEFPGA